MKLEHKIIEKYIIDRKRFRLSLPFFNREIYIPEQVIRGLGLEIKVGELPKRVKLPGKLISEDYREHPCQGWVYNVEEYDKKDNTIDFDENLIHYNHQVFLGFDSKVLRSEGSKLIHRLKTYEEAMTFYVAKIPSFTRYAKDQTYYQGIYADTVTKEVIFEKIVIIDYRKQIGFIDVV